MTTTLDEARVEQFAGRLFETYTGGMVTLMIDLGYRIGLFDALATAAATSEELASRAGLSERYVRECLGALVTSEIVEYDPGTRTYALPPEHAVCLTGGASTDLAPISQIVGLLGKHVGAVARCARDGGGVPYDEFRPEFTEVMDGMSRGLFDTHLLTNLVPRTGALAGQLATGIRVADIGCGTGHALSLLARAYPQSTFVGYDIGADAIEAARREATQQGLHNLTFEVLDVTLIPLDPPFTAVFAFDAIHDQVAPAAVLRRVHDALVPGGYFVMMDIKAASDLEGNIGNPFAPMLYATSTLHCMTVSLAHDGAGLGTVWGEQLALQMLSDAGFGPVKVFDVPDDPMDSLYVTRRP